MGQRYVLLDRDGTIIVDRHYLTDPSGVELIEGAADALRELASLGLGIVVITNQSAIGRGYLDVGGLARIHQRLTSLLAERGAHLDGIYWCPHRPDERCDCRKPRTGLARRAARELDFDPGRGFVVGDKPADVELGEALGATTVLVRTGKGARTEAERAARPDHVVDDLLQAARVIASLIEAGRQE
jgi:D-glycero-D-manno-heptose 1,7-bisphosphate phosphatase